jgi:hypothetical protein
MGRSRSASSRPSASTRSLGRRGCRTDRRTSHSGLTGAGIPSAPSTTPPVSSVSRSSRRSVPLSTAREAATASVGTPSARATATEGPGPTGTTASGLVPSRPCRCSTRTARSSARSSPTITTRRPPPARRSSACASACGRSSTHTEASLAPAHSTSLAIRTDSPSVRRAIGSMTMSTCSPPGCPSRKLSVQEPLSRLRRGFRRSGAALSCLPRSKGVYACARTCGAWRSVG